MVWDGLVSFLSSSVSSGDLLLNLACSFTSQCNIGVSGFQLTSFERWI